MAKIDTDRGKMSTVTGKLFLALDGDDIGRRLDLHLLTEDADGLRAFAAAFEDLLDEVLRNINNIPSVEVLFRGGDSLLLAIATSRIKSAIDIIRITIDGSGFAFSGGYGKTMRDAYLALRIAKASGKNQILSLD